ncbi:DNA polymerase III subunit gamma and tau [Microlunatus capsulatus]|uniref:DNA polymerase III subunit gamma and tau n=1 Tax=Microlunatus capsulatus TaxID=99117 RepID=UPI001FD8D8C8|nr:DNA polymerase III subunit gamma and tau [Microlunatus capsulatus]
MFDGPPPSTGSATGAAPLALYRRYRPDTFADVIGQEHVTAPLQRALTNNRVNHAYLFSGPRGCGKTTSARILARCLNCELGPRAEPCGTCRSCRDLARGAAGSIDVIEIDAASHGGVDDARDLRERAFFAPVQSRYKIYIIDEAHMVTPQGFNALLKLVEEPPPHVKFIFATTEPDKVIGTIRSRTHHYPFRLVPPKVLTDYLGKLCAAEGIAVEQTVLPLVVRAGAGSVRDSLSVLDQLLGGAEESGVSYRHATALLGYTPDSLLDEFVDAFAAGDAGGVFSCVDKVIEVGQDPRRFAEDLLRRLRDLVIVAAVPDALRSGLVEVAPDQAERLSSQAAALGSGELTRAAEVIAAGLTDMRGTTAPRLHLELMCARVLLPGADVDERGVHARLDRIERRLGVSVPAGDAPAQHAPVRPAPLDPSPVRPAAPAPAAAPVPSAAPASTATRPPPSGTSVSAAPEAGPAQPSADPEPSAPPSRLAEPPRAEPPASLADAAPADLRGPSGGDSDDTALGAPAPAPAASPGAGSGQLTVTDVRRLWPEVLEEVKGKRRFTWILLSQNAQVHELRNGVMVLAMANVGARDSFSRGGSEDVLREALVVVLGADFKIETLVEGGPSTPTPATRPAPVDQQAAASWDAPAPAPAAAPIPPPEPPPAEPDRSESREQLRQQIRPTRQGPAVASTDDERDAAATRNDSDLEDSAESHTELLARHLGAEIIAEETERA